MAGGYEFEDVIDKMPAHMRRLQECKPMGMETRAERHALRRRLPADEGIYVLYESDRPMYVGRLDNLADRLLSHGRPSSGSESATFAFNLARRDFPGSLSRGELRRDEEFSRHFARARERVRGMEVRVVALADPIEQTIFEVYAHLKLGTPFNSFENH